LPNRHRVPTLAQRLNLLIANPIRSPGIVELVGDQIAHTQLVIHIPQQHHSRVAGDPLVRKFHLDRSIEFRSKSARLIFTHRVNLRERFATTFNPDFTRWFLFFCFLVNNAGS
jgi:hypothetical protein